MYNFTARSTPIVFLLMIAAGLFFSSVAIGQTTTANIEGTVQDDKGNPAQDVEVVARNQETGNYHIVYSSEKGQYRVSALTPTNSHCRFHSQEQRYSRA
ncbi:MAG: carboxypeptidase regulatory-like domain-containing protein [Ignavibacteriales bacterium]|nr:carboxypeptidase regulatory-like domain-containing protein [Ignavibacteriales bacterium]